MKTHRAMAFCAVLSAFFLVTCSKDPGIYITSPLATATVYGNVTPFAKTVRVSIVRDGDTLASTMADTVSGLFVFRNVPYDVYAFYATNGIQSGYSLGWMIDRPLSSGGQIFLYERNGIISKAPFANGDILIPDTSFGDSLMSFDFIRVSSAIYGARPCSLTITPTFLNNHILWSRNEVSRADFSIPKRALFSVPNIVMTWRTLKTNSPGVVQRDSVSYSYTIDSTGIGRALTKMLLRNYTPKSYTPDFSREANMTVEFARPMNHDSVEKSIIISPAVAVSFYWSGNLLTITPANALKPDIKYSVEIGKCAMTADSLHMSMPFAFSFTAIDQGMFRRTWPISGSVGVPTNIPFEFSSDYSITPELIQSSFSITPTVDSLAFKMDQPGYVTVTHAALRADTTYQITIDSACQSRKGVLLGKDLLISFRTVSH